MIFVTPTKTGTPSGSPGKINVQVCGNPEKSICEECLSSNMTWDAKVEYT